MNPGRYRISPAPKKRVRKAKPKPEETPAPLGLTEAETTGPDGEPVERAHWRTRAELVDAMRRILAERPNHALHDVTGQNTDNLTVLALLGNLLDWGSGGGGAMYFQGFNVRFQGKPKPHLWLGGPPFPKRPDAEGMELVAITREAIATTNECKACGKH